nr:MAG TPA: hypothetical protein [Caudoviricetes sp.]
MHPLVRDKQPRMWERMTLSCGCTTPHGRTGSSHALSPAHNACGNRRSYVS